MSKDTMDNDTNMDENESEEEEVKSYEAPMEIENQNAQRATAQKNNSARIHTRSHIEQENEETPHTGTIIYTDGSYSREMAGAGVYDETNKQTYTYTFVGTQNALAAELVALRQAVTLGGKTKEKTRIYTDSLTSLFLIRKWIHAPNKLKLNGMSGT